MRIADFLSQLCASPEYLGQIAHVEHIPARAAEYGALSRPLPPALAEALARRGLERFYRHQAQAIDMVRDGRHVVVATGTASGKTLCYNVPVLEAALADPLSRALYLFPTKALAQDQLRALGELTSARALKAVRYGAYDGDTPTGERSRLRRTASILLSNPDMLSAGILPHHSAWAFFFRRLRYVVLDEAHTYRGVFGSHLACVLRRLRRVCALYGSDPRFILCSATIANPREHAGRLTGQEAGVVDRDGAPHGPREFLLWNPPFLDAAAGRRRSVNTEAAWISTAMVEQGIRHITFVRARKVAELISLYVQNALRREHRELADRVSAYRGGYLARERRDIERRLFSGELLSVVATTALELGIDVGQLDASLLVGYPGTIASTWQQAGRAGRGQGESLSILIGQDDPLDQYYMRHPADLFGRAHEHALIDPGNLYLLQAHLACAAFESPLNRGDSDLFGPGFDAAREVLEQEGTLEPRGGRWFYRPDDYPASRVNLRGSSSDKYLLVEETGDGRVLEEIDAATAFIRIYPGGVYLHRAESYLITRLDIDGRVAYARRTDEDYYTQPLEQNELHIIRSLLGRPLGATDLFFGRVRVTQRVTGYLRKEQFTGALLSVEPLDLPSSAFETQAIWFEVPEAIRQRVAEENLDFGGGLHAVEHACIGILPLFAMCDRDDIGGQSTLAHADTGQVQIFIHDGYPGGVGIVRKGYDLVEELWARTLEVIRSCPCEAGCPSCIQSPKCGSNNEPLDKRAAVVILEELLGR